MVLWVFRTVVGGLSSERHWLNVIIAVVLNPTHYIKRTLHHGPRPGILIVTHNIESIADACGEGVSISVAQ